MVRRRSVLRVVGGACVFLLWTLSGLVLHAQDRGAPRFGPSTPTDTVEAEASDAGRLWSVAAPPFERFEERYDVPADSAWATHLRRGLLRLPHCTAALVSARGLALTSAECIRRTLDTGRDGAPVVAEERGDERVLASLHVDRLVGATDVTAQVRAARQDTTVQQAVAMVQQQLRDDAGANRRVEVRATAGGAPYTAYTYRRHDDVRLAFLPERRLSEFGGISATMTYPRQTLDVALIRIYGASGTPLRPEHFFEAATQGIRPGDAVFSAGFARATRRAATADQLAVRRDLVLPNRTALLTTWIRATRALETVPDSTQHSSALDAAKRALKRSRARLEALQNDYVMTRLRRRDADLRTALRRDSSLTRRFGGLLDSLVAVQAARRKLGPEYRAFGHFEADHFTSQTFRRMRRLLRPTSATGSPPANPDSTAWSEPVETALLADRLRRFAALLRPDTSAVRRLFNGRSPEERAAVILDESVLGSPGTEGVKISEVPESDPASTLFDLLADRARSFYEEWARLNRAERSLTRRLAQARQAVRSSPVRPAAARSPRLTDGRVLGYPYNGTVAPPFTTFFGLFAQNRAFEERGNWALPARWEQARTTLDRAEPLTLAASTDPAVGRRGAPLLNKYLEVVGVAVGANIQAVAGEYLFLPERMRSVAVDLRGLRESLRSVYAADRLADELSGARSGPTEPSR